MEKVAYITKAKYTVEWRGVEGAILVHRADIASVAAALINAAEDNDTRRGIALLATALGCEVTTE